jgi:hypothetical protein
MNLLQNSQSCQTPVTSRNYANPILQFPILKYSSFLSAEIFS